MTDLGRAVLDLCKDATREVLLVAPFIKVSALERILEVIPEGVSSVRCVTRWRPEEIAAGVSDLEVFDVIAKRSGGKLYLHPYLHAKYFRADESCLVGSANLTLRGLGWAIPSNFELIIPHDGKSPHAIRFESLLFSAAIEATEAFKKEMLSLVNGLDFEGIKYIADEPSAEDETKNLSTAAWLPLCTRPELLFQIYSEENTEEIVGWTLKAGRRDIEVLEIPFGLSRIFFRSYVAAFLQQSSLGMQIFELAKSPIYPHQGQKLIEEEVDEKHRVYDVLNHWTTLRNWLLHFLPHIYRQPSGSDAIQRGEIIGVISKS